MAEALDQGEGLTAQQRRFALEYLSDPSLNAKQAAIRAGYSPRTAEGQASRLLRNVKVQAFVGCRLRAVEKKLELSVERLEEELARVALFDPRGAYDETGRLLPVAEMPEDVRRNVAGFEEEALFDTVVVGEGPKGGKVKERVQVGVVRKVKWHGKVEAIALGMKRRGALVDRSEVTVREGAEEVSEEEWERLAALKHQVRAKDPDAP